MFQRMPSALDHPTLDAPQFTTGEALVHRSRRTEVVRIKDPQGSGTVLRKTSLLPDGRRLRQEIAALARLGGAPGIVHVVPDPPAHAESGTPALWMLDAGSPLSKILETERLSLAESLRVTCCVAEALAAVHDAGLIHKDVSPSNILVGSDGAVTLIDFDSAAAAGEENALFVHHAHLSGVLAYLSPEQTGRTGRIVDSRADLYSLGIVLYKLVTGRLPFDQQDPLQLLHDQLVRVPEAPNAVDPTVPNALSEVVMRLLEKEADRRYQSAEGLAHDLRLLRQGPRAGPTLALGKNDFASWLAAPSRLVGRAAAKAMLEQSVSRAVEDQQRCLLVAGAAGVGKTALLNELRPIVSRRMGWLVHSKFDQYRRITPGAAHDALRALGRLLLAEPEQQLTEHRRRLIEALGPNVGLGPAQLPEFKLLLGQRPAISVQDPREAEARTLKATIDILRSVASPAQPLVLVLDDVQWAAPLTLRMIDAVLTDAHSIPGLMIVAACRTTDVDAGHPWRSLLSRWEALGLMPPAIELEDLRRDEVGELLAQMLRLPAGRVDGLAAALFECTGGNAFDTVALVNTLRDDGLLQPMAGLWHWDADAIRRHYSASRVLDLLTHRISRLDRACRTVLETMACLGGRVPSDLVEIACDISPAMLDASLQPLLQDGLLSLDREEGATLSFRHDRIQQAVLERSSSHDLAALQLMLARRLAGHASHAQAAAEQYLSAIQLLRSDAGPDECRLVATLFQRAAGQVIYADGAAAQNFLTAALGLLDRLPDDETEAWRSGIELELHRTLYGLGRLNEADALFAALFPRELGLLELAQATGVQAYSLKNRSRSAEGLALGMAVLDKIGCPRPDDLERNNRLAFRRLCDWLQSGATTADFERPALDRPDATAQAHLIGKLTPIAFNCDIGTFLWLVLASAELWIREGPCRELMQPLGGVPVVLAHHQEHRLAYQAGRHFVAVGQARDYSPDVGLARVGFALHAAHWFEPIESVAAHFRTTRDEVLRSGDYMVASYTYVVHDVLLDSRDLQHAEMEADEAMLFCHRKGNTAHYQRNVIMRQMHRALRGRTRSPGSFDDDDFDEAAYLAEPTTLGVARLQYNIYRAIVATIFDDVSAAHRFASESFAQLRNGGGLYFVSTARTLNIAAQAALARQTALPAAERLELIERLREEQLPWVAQRAVDMPQNYLHLLWWLEAELAWTADDTWAAGAKFERAVKAAADHRRPWHHALISERAARFHLDHGFDRTGRALLRQARDAYAAWGADGKVKALHDEFAELRQTLDATADREATRSGPVTDDLDLMAVLRASQALSSQTSLAGLAERLTSVLKSMTGATGVYLLVRPSHHETWSLATARDSEERDGETQAPPDRIEPPMAVARYAERTREVLVIEDAKQDDRFLKDPFFEALAQCSILAVPIFSHGEMRGMLILENRQARNAFSLQRIEALELIARQLTVSLDNARLYASLEEKVAERTAALRDTNDQLQALIEIRDGELASASALKAAIIDHAMEAIVTTDDAAAIVDFNPAAERLFGCARHAVLGQHVERLMYGDDRARLNDIMRSLEAPQGTSGSSVGERCTMQAQRADGMRFDVETVLWRSAVEGNALFTLSMRDITDQLRNAETIERQRNELRQNEKLTMMGGLLAGVAHELNNPLAVVMGRASLLEEMSEGSPLAQEAQRIRDAAQRCGRIVRTFLNMARQRETPRSEVRLNDIVLGAADMLGYMLRTRGIQLQLDLAPDLPGIVANGDQVGQVVLNLMVNAEHAMAQVEGERRLRVETGWHEEHEGKPARLWFRVSDSGPGVPPALAERIFQPFFTTKAEGAGTGLGLSMCLAIAREHGGDLLLEPPSATGGASFYCWLPLTGSTAAATPSPAGTDLLVVTPSAATATSHRVLVVDDEPELLDVMRAVLEGAGIEVACAESGGVALEMLQLVRCDAIVSDFRMPDMSGSFLWEQVKTHYPELAGRILFVTGDMLSLDVSHFLTQSGCRAIEKPFSTDELARSVLSMLSVVGSEDE
jgi:PAS domain S-box-containing protein